MKINILDLIDREKLDTLLTGFSKTSGFVSAIADLDGIVVSRSGGQSFGSEFQKIYTETEKLYTNSIQLHEKFAQNEQFHFFQGDHGLHLAAGVIKMNEQHIANLFLGPFLFNESESAALATNSNRLKTDTAVGKEALARIPVVSKENVQDAMDFLLSTIQLIGDMSSHAPEKKKAGKRIRGTEDKFLSVFETANAGTSITLPTGEIEVNETFCRLLGYTREELKSKTWKDITPEDDIEKVQNLLEPLLSGETKSARFEKRYICKNGNYIWADVSVSAQYDEHEKLLYFVTIMIDITDRKEAEISLRDEKEQKRIILELVGDPIFLKDNEHRLIFANRAFLDLFGLEEDQVLGRTLAETVPENERHSFLQIDRKVLETGIADCREEELTLGGKTHTVVTRKTRIIDESGKPFLVCSIHNITERKRIEEEMKSLLEREHFLAEIIRCASTPFSVGFPDGKLGMCNQAFLTLTGYTEAELKDIKWNDVLTPEEWFEYEVKQLAIVHETKQSVKYEKEYTHKLGHRIPIELVVNPFFNEEGNATHYYAFITDLTERKRAENLIIKNKNRLDYALTSIDTGVWELDLLRGSSWRSLNHDEIFGYTQALKDWTYEDFLNHVIPEDKELVDVAFRKALASKSSWDFECRIKRKDGAVRWILGKGNHENLINKNETQKLYGIVQDITERKLAEEALRESEKILSVIFNNHTDLQLLVKVDEDLTITAINDPYINTALSFGIEIEADQVVGKPVRELFRILGLGQDVFEISAERYFTAAKTGQSITYQEEIEVLGAFYTSEVTLNPVMGENGDCQYILFNSHNTTEQTRANEALVESEEKFEKSFLLSPYMVSLSSIDGTVVEVNDKVFDVFGYTRNEFIGLNTSEIGIWVNKQERQRFLHELLAVGVLHEMEVEFYKKSGETGDYLLSASIIEVSGKKLLLAIIHDITERKKAQKEIKKLNAELEMKVKHRTAQLAAINKELETFTYSVSHDLKAPLRGIDGYSKLLLDEYKPKLDEEAQTFIKTIRSSTLQMSQLIDDLLDYSRLERSELSMERVNIKDLITSVVSLLKADLEASHFELKVESDDIEFLADPQGLALSLRNLVENAIKFSKGKEKPFIHIKVEDKKRSCILSVTDNGIGFDMKYHHKIFKIFQRLQRVEDFPGTGIGLAMVGKAMQRMNGHVWAESFLGQGSTFYLEIPKMEL